MSANRPPTGAKLTKPQRAALELITAGGVTMHRSSSSTTWSSHPRVRPAMVNTLHNRDLIEYSSETYDRGIRSVLVEITPRGRDVLAGTVKAPIPVRLVVVIGDLTVEKTDAVDHYRWHAAGVSIRERIIESLCVGLLSSLDGS